MKRLRETLNRKQRAAVVSNAKYTIRELLRQQAAGYNVTHFQREFDRCLALVKHITPEPPHGG